MNCLSAFQHSRVKGASGLRNIFLLLLAVTLVAGERSEPKASPAVQLIHNGAFEAGEFPDWSLLARGGGEGTIACDSAHSVDNTSGYALRLTVVNVGHRSGVAYQPEEGLNVEAGSWYDFTFRALSKPRENNRGYGLTVSLESPDGNKVCARSTIPEVGGEWMKYTLALNARHSYPKARLVIAMSEPGTIWLDDISLVRREASTASGLTQQSKE